MVERARRQIGQTDIAKAVGVSVGTVSNTLNRPELVAEATRTKILQAMKRLDFVPNEAAASLRRGTNRLFGLVVPDITNSFYAEIASGVAGAADALNYGVVLCNSGDDPARELVQLQMLTELRVAGALVVPLTADPVRLTRIRDFGTHVVLIDRVADTHDGCSVAVDDVLGGDLAFRHLLATRGQHLLLLNGQHSIPQCVDRRRGAIQALVRAGASADDLREVVVGEMTRRAGHDAAVRLIAEHTRLGTSLPSGIFCTNDQLAIGVIRALHEHGFNVPQTTAIVGYGDLVIALDAPVPLTSVGQPNDAVGRSAVEALFAEVSDTAQAHVHASRVLQPTLVVRESAP